MIKHAILFITIGVFASNIVNAQFEIQGIIKNTESKPVEFAEVILFKNDSVFYKAAYTNIEGKFSINAPENTYKLIIRELNEIYYNKNIDLNKNLDLGQININNSKKLNEVVVTGQKKLFEKKIDRLVFNVEKSILATGGNALDVLQITPSVRITNDVIGLVGKGTIAVMVNDRMVQLSGEDLSNYLRSFPSNIIESIEIITNPPAKYTAQGNSGLINIKLKKVIQDNWSLTLQTNLTHATYAYGNLGGIFTLKKKKHSLMVDITNSYRNNRFDLKTNYIYPSQIWESQTYIYQKPKSLFSLLTYTYDWNKKWSSGIQYDGYQSKRKNSTNGYLNISEGNSLIQNILTIGENDEKYKQNNFNFNTLYKIDTLGKKMNIDFDYLGNKVASNFPTISTETNFKNTEELINRSEYQITNLSSQKVNNIAGRLDFELPYNKITLNIGGKLSTSLIKSENTGSINQLINKVLNPIIVQENIYHYTEKSEALYFSGEKNISKQLTTKLGVRFESIQMDGYSEQSKQNITKRYNQFFPSAYLQYKKNDNHAITFDYARRIDRPSFYEFNPAKWYTSIKMVQYGNPFLMPAFSNNITLSYSFKDIFTSAIVYLETKNSFGQVTIPKADIVETQRLNYNNSKYINWDNTLIINPSKKWQSTNVLSFWISNTDTFIPELLPNYKGQGAYFSTNNNFTITKNLKVQLNFNNNFKTRNGETITLNYSSLDLGLRNTFKNERISIAILAKNILKSDIIPYQIDINKVQTNFQMYYDTRLIRMSLSYKFGSEKVNVEKHEGSNSDEKNRASK